MPFSAKGRAIGAADPFFTAGGGRFLAAQPQKQIPTNRQLGRRAEARVLLKKGEALAPNASAEHGLEKFGNAWLPWLFARITLDEVRALLQSQAPEKSLTKP